MATKGRKSPTTDSTADRVTLDGIRYEVTGRVSAGENVKRKLGAVELIGLRRPRGRVDFCVWRYPNGRYGRVTRMGSGGGGASAGGDVATEPHMKLLRHPRETFEVFRGDPVRIERFDERKIKRGEYGRGFYFVDDMDAAMKYGPIVDAYRVTLHAPHKMSQFGFLRELVELLGEPAPSGIEARSRWITEKLQGLGFDGIVVKMSTGITYVVAFEPKQIERIEERAPPRVPQGTPIRARARPMEWKPAF